MHEKRMVYGSQAYEQVGGRTKENVNKDLPGWLERVHPDDLLHLRQRMRGELVQNVEVRWR
ncbi:hypothetical protein K3G63_21745 [Hymenobacter sp. HSC-4F20]|uniref:hypothetical protein n=1 Tax=Hymenobacter sp. HSC-4F20 TaxID=2864135 RepID=UPI001C736FBF|nr:hypothetical protein [Hymenobacter sp. HSC-4F20]MBX0293083.1 hypothetical protein [Hymenobacter sp. HSC-4F20]